MTVDVKNSDATEVSEGILRLLTEYTGKLEQFLNRVEAKAPIAAKSGYAKTSFAGTPVGLPLSVQWDRLLPGLNDLISAASQLVENGAQSDFQQVELRVRLAELEALMRGIDSLLSSPVY